MTTHTRRTFLALAGASAFLATRAAARPLPMVTTPLFSCGAVMATPEIIRVESDMSFEHAYLDTTIPYHGNALLLTEAAFDDLDDDRVIAIAEDILASHPDNLELLGDIREELLGDSETEESTHEKMLIAMGGMESCTDESHMNFLDSEWVLETFSKNDDPLFAYVSMMVLLLEMEMHQHMVGVELAEHQELHHFCERMVEVQTPHLEVLKEVRGELFTRY